MNKAIDQRIEILQEAVKLKTKKIYAYLDEQEKQTLKKLEDFSNLLKEKYAKIDQIEFIDCKSKEEWIHNLENVMKEGSQMEKIQIAVQIDKEYQEMQEQSKKEEKFK